MSARPTRRRVAVIGGGANAEHEISLASAASAAEALADRHDVVRLTIDRSGQWWVEGEPIGLADAVETIRDCDVVMPLLHGRHGEDGTLAALCDLAGAPWVGSPLGAAAIAMDKWATKLVAQAVGVRTAAGVLLTRDAAPAFTGPCVVKPVTAGSSIGVGLVRTATALPAALDAAFAHDDRVLVEELLIGREIDVAVIARPDGSRMVSPALEIAACGIFDFASKYDGSTRFVVPAALDPAELDALRTAAVTVFDALGCRGLARVDFFLTGEGPVLNEVNTTPGFTARSQAPRMFAAAGLPYPDLLDMLVADALC